MCLLKTIPVTILEKLKKCDFMRLRFPATKPTQHPACQPRCRPRWASPVGLWRVPSCPCSLLRRLSCGLQGREPRPCLANWDSGRRLERVGACLPILSLWSRSLAGFVPKRKAQLLQSCPHSFSQVPSGLRGGTAHRCPRPSGTLPSFLWLSCVPPTSCKPSLY